MSKTNKLNDTGNVMVLGKTGSGKTAISVEAMRTFLSERQLRGWRDLRKDIQKDGKRRRRRS